MLYYTILSTGAICGLTALFAWHNRAQRGARVFAALMLGVMIWALAYAQELNSASLPAKIFWSKVEYLGIVVVPVAWLLFGIEYAGHTSWISARRLALLGLPSLLTLALVGTNEAHGLIWSSIGLVQRGGFVGWKATYGAGFWAFTGYAYILLLIGTTLLLRIIILQPALYRRQAGALLIGSLLPWLGNLLYNFNLSPLPGVELAPFAFTVTGLIFVWALWRWQLIDIVPIARDRVIERMRDGVIVLDARARVVDINPAACQVLGWERGAVIGRAILPILGQYAPMLERFVDADEADEQITVELDGQTRVFQLRISPLEEWPGTTGGRLVLLSDITRIKRAERELIDARAAAEQANAAKSVFLASMSHEIRTPMNGVLGMAELLLDSGLNEPQQDMVQMIHSSGSQLMRIINTILDFSKAEAGQIELDPQPFDLRTCVESALDVVAAAAAEKGLDLSYTIAPGTPTTIVQDQTRLRQILVNLLSNGVKFTQRGEVTLSVGDAGGRTGQDLAHSLAFAVRDTGIGIPADRRDRLFRSFSQGDAATARTYGGTGLGLAISKLLAEAMGGAISVESTPGAGATFSFVIAAGAAPDLTPQPCEAASPALRGKRALIVEDGAGSRLGLATQLAAWGMQPTAAESSEAALALLRAGETFDLVLLDAQLPGAGGAALVAAIRALQPARPAPTIMLSALGAPARPGERGIAVLHKPVKLTRLYEVAVGLLSAQDFGGPLPAAQQPSGATDGEMARLMPLRILIAEDNRINQQLMTRMLARLGYQADIVSDGAAAVAALQTADYDLILMDVQMPGMDGLEATRGIRAGRAGGRQPWIIAVTAGAIDGDREACFSAGMNDFIVKPVDQLVLAQALARHPQAGQAVAAERAGEAADQPIDLAVLQQLKRTLGDQSEAIFPGLVRTFIESAASLQDAARQALCRGDCPTLRRAMHTLKSNANTFGAQRLAVLCRELEQRAAQGSLEGAEPLLDKVAGEFAQVRAALAGL